MKASSDKSHFFVTHEKFLGHIIKGTTVTSLISRIDASLKLQTLSNKKKTQNSMKKKPFSQSKF